MPKKRIPTSEKKVMVSIRLRNVEALEKINPNDISYAIDTLFDQLNQKDGELGKLRVIINQYNEIVSKIKEMLAQNNIEGLRAELSKADELFNEYIAFLKVKSVINNENGQ
jgi:ATP-dependent RNA circularization protein (DNA/RNA ligase family)